VKRKALIRHLEACGCTPKSGVLERPAILNQATMNLKNNPAAGLLRDEIDERGITAAQAARDMRVPRSRLSDIFAGRKGISADTALRVERYLGVSASLLLRLQADFDLSKAKREKGKLVEREVLHGAASGIDGLWGKPVCPHRREGFFHSLRLHRAGRFVLVEAADEAPKPVPGVAGVAGHHTSVSGASKRVLARSIRSSFRPKRIAPCLSATSRWAITPSAVLAKAWRWKVA
jgi:addiction module HigA family antidote